LARARGVHRPDSDLDLAVVLKGQRRDFIDTKLDMAGIAFDVLMETGVLVQLFPMDRRPRASGTVHEPLPYSKYRGRWNQAWMTKEIMDKAEKALASASILFDAGDSDGATNRAYYAMFDAAVAALSWAGVGLAQDQHKTHGGLIGSFGLHLV
jgi:hypothetical protein